MAVQERFGDQVRIIGMPGATDDPAAVNAFVAATNSGSLVHVPDYDRSIWDQFGGMHRSYLYIDDDGSTRVGAYGNLQQGVEELVAQ